MLVKNFYLLLVVLIGTISNFLFINYQVVSAAVSAKEIEWTGMQSLTVLGMEKNLYSDCYLEMRTVALRTSVHLFQVLTQSFAMLFTYSGPVFYFDNFWFSPQLGVADNWKGKDLLNLSLWAGMNIGSFSLFVEGDQYVKENFHDYYGYYSVDYEKVGFAFGAQCEQVGDLLWFGPHLGVYKSVSNIGLSIQLQNYVGFQEENKGYSLRVQTGVSF